MWYLSWASTVEICNGLLLCKKEHIIFVMCYLKIVCYFTNLSQK